MPALGSKHCRR